jgi:hypothetical protein
MHTLLAPRACARFVASASVALALLVACGTSGCSSDDPSPAAGPEADSIEAELFASTRKLDDADLALLAASDDVGTLTFASEPPGLRGVEVGQVILAGMSPKTPAGLLRVVAAVERDPSGNVVLRTVSAPLQVAFRKLHARVHRTVQAADPGGSFVLKDTSPLARPLSLSPQYTVASGEGGADRTYEIVVFDGDGDVSTTNDQIRLDATLGGGFAYALDVDVDWGLVDRLPDIVTDCLKSVAKLLTGEKPSCAIDDLIPEARAVFNVDPFVRIDAKARGAASLEFEKNLDVAAVNLPPFALGPLVFAPTIDVVAEVKGGASARFDVGATLRADLTTGVTVSTKNAGRPEYNEPRIKDVSFDVHPPTVDLHASAEAKVGARLNVSLYGVVGPYAMASGVASVAASPLENPCWRLHVALEGELGMRITTPRLPALGYVTLADFRAPPFRPLDKEVASGACVVPPEPPNPPGAGPTPSVYRSPPFTPWAKKLVGKVDGLSTWTGSFRLGWPELVPTVDGRYLAMGAYSRAAHKIDPAGALTWTAALAPAQGGSELRALASAPTSDAGLMTLVEAPIGTGTFALVKMTQSGAVEWSRAYTFPPECNARTGTLVRDGDRGYLVLGQCIGDGGFLVRVDGRGGIVRARALHDSDPQSSGITPIGATVTAGELLLMGEVASQNELEWTFVSRLDADARPVVSTAFYCPERITMVPSAIAPAEDGGVTIAGEANGPGFVARVRKDGSVGFVSFPNLGLGVLSNFLISGIAELPATGMVLVASTREPGTEASGAIVLGGVDSGGKPMWARKYMVTAPVPRSLAVGAMKLTDDGGALVTAVADRGNGEEGDLYAMKVFAKDGYLGDGTEVASSPLALENYECTITSRPLAPVVQDIVVTSASIDLERR